MSQVSAEHRATAPDRVICAVITVSDTRTPETDTGGQAVCDHLTAAGFLVAHRDIIPDDPARMRPLLEKLRDDPQIDAILLTGGTGLSSRDQTFETVTALITKQLPGYGELFRMLSYEDIGAAAMLSRATAGVYRSTFVVSTPGSPNAVQIAVERLIIPEINHLAWEILRKS
jgi:molybdenum cofactor biosynthesis protein B